MPSKDPVLEEHPVPRLNMFNQVVAAQSQPDTGQQQIYVEVSTGCQTLW